VRTKGGKWQAVPLWRPAEAIARPAGRAPSPHGRYIFPDVPGETGLAAPSPCRTQPLPAELLGSRLLPYVRSNFQSNAAFFRSNSGRNGKAGRL
jgi:hypothetical protein